MLKNKRILIAILIAISIIFSMFTVVNATDNIKVTRNIYSNNGSMKFKFTGLTLDMTHEYEFGLTKTKAAKVEQWFLILEYTETTATVDIITTTNSLREVINAVDTGYITIKDKTTDTIILQPYSVDLKTPYLNLTNYTVISNGKEFNTSINGGINIALRCASNSEPYYQYEKITDQNIINKYKQIKANNGDFNELQYMLTKDVPNSNWSTWAYWNGYDSSKGMNGYGYPQSTIEVPDTGLYYLWVYFSGNNLKPVYGYILVDNLEPEIALDSISLPKTWTIELGKTLTLTPTFTPSNTTNKIVNWTSSDEEVATVNNAGKITAKKVGSTIITVTSQDGNKKATCTVTVTSIENNDQEQDKNEKPDTTDKEQDKTEEKEPVTKTLQSIAITSAPTKTTYTVGEKFNSAGMKILATYSDGSKSYVTGECTYSPSGKLTKNDTTITISYTENGVTKTAKQSIKIDTTIASGNIPYTGGTTVIIASVVAIIAVGAYVYKRNRDLKGI